MKEMYIDSVQSTEHEGNVHWQRTVNGTPRKCTLATYSQRIMKAAKRFPSEGKKCDQVMRIQELALHQKKHFDVLTAEFAPDKFSEGLLHQSEASLI